jgi:hypothetical protein
MEEEPRSFPAKKEEIFFLDMINSSKYCQEIVNGKNELQPILFLRIRKYYVQ